VIAESQAKKAADIIKKSKKGSWVKVPEGKRASEVAQKNEVKLNKVSEDAKTSRGDDKTAIESKVAERSISKSEAKSQDKKKKIINEILDAKQQLKLAKDTANEATGGAQEMNAIKAAQKAKAVLLGLEKRKVKSQNEVEADLKKKEGVQKKLLKAESAVEGAKAQTRRMAMQNKLDKAFETKNPVATQDLLIKYAGKAKKAAERLGEIKSKEGVAFDQLKTAKMQIERQENLIRSIKLSMNPEPVKLKIASLRARLAKESRALSKVKTKEIDAKDKLSAVNVKYDMVDEHEKDAVGKLQHGFVVQARAKNTVEKEQTDLHKVLAKAEGTLKYSVKEKRDHSRKLSQIKKAVAKAKKETAEERKAKASLASNQAINATETKKMTAAEKSMSDAKHQTELNKIQLKVATLAVNSKKLAYDAATGVDKATAVDAVMTAKSTLEKAEQAKTLLEMKLTGLGADIESSSANEKKVKGAIRSALPVARRKTNLAGPELDMEVTQKSVAKYAQKVERSKITIAGSEKSLEKASPRWKAVLSRVKDGQGELVKQAKQAQSTITTDKTKEAGAKKAAKILDESQEKVAKQIATTNDAIMDAEDDLRKTGLAQRADQLTRAKSELKKMVSEKNKKKKVAGLEEAKVSSAAQEARLSKMGMTKAGFLEKDLSSELKMQEKGQKSATQKSAAQKAGEKTEKSEQVAMQKAMLKRQEENKARMVNDQQAARVQQAQAESLLTSLEADLASSRDGFARAEEAVRKATTTAAKQEDSVYKQKANLSKARAMVADSKNKWQAAVDAKAAAKKAATLGSQKATQAGDSVIPAETALKSAKDTLEGSTKNVQEKTKEVSEAQKALSKAKTDLAKNRIALKAAWSAADKARMTEQVQDSGKKVTKLSEDYDVLDKRLTALKALEQNAKLKVEESKASLAAQGQLAHSKKEKLLAQVSEDTKAAAEAQARADAIDSSIKAGKDKISTLVQDKADAKRAYKRDKQVLAQEKGSMTKYQNKEASLGKETANAKVTASQLKAVNAVKLTAEKAKAKTQAANMAVQNDKATATKEKQAEKSEVQASGKEENTEAKISSLKRQLEDAGKRDKKVADKAFAAATQPTTGISRKATKAELKKQKLGESQKAASTAAAAAKTARFMFMKAKRKYRDMVKSKEASQKNYQFRTSESAIKTNSRKLTELKESLGKIVADTRDIVSKRSRILITFESTQEHLGTVKKTLTKIAKAQKKLASKINMVRTEQKGAAGSLSDPNLNAADTEAAKMNLSKFNVQLTSLEGKLNAGKISHGKVKGALVRARQDFKAAKRAMTGVDAKLAGSAKYKLKLKAKIAEEDRFSTTNRKIARKMKKDETAVVTLKRAMVKARNIMGDSNEESQDLSRSELADSLDYKDAKTDLSMTVAAKDSKDAAAVQAAKDEEAKRLLTRELSKQTEKLKTESTEVKVDSAEAKYLKSLKKKSDAQAKEKEKEAVKAEKKEEKAAVKAEAKTAKVEAKEAPKVSSASPASYKAQRQHLENLIDGVDIGKLVARSKRALAKSILEKQGKPVPKDPDTEPLSDLEQKKQRQLEEKKLKFMKKEEVRKIREMKAAQKAAAVEKETGIVKEADSKNASKKAIEGAEVKRAANNDKARNAIADARADRDLAANKLSKEKAKWSVTVARGNAKAVAALALKLKVEKQVVAHRMASIKLLARQAADKKAAGAAALVEAKAKAVADEEQIRAKNEMAKKKAAALVKKDVKKAEAVANKVEEEKKQIEKPSAKKKDDWQKNYENVVANAKPSGSTKKPGKTRSQERSEKSYSVIQRANVMIEKIKKLNAMSKDKSKAPAEKGATDAALNQAKAKELAAEAETHAKAAAAAAKIVAALSAQAPSKDTEAALAKAKAEETAAKEKADVAIEKAKTAAKAGGKAGKELEKQAEAKAAQAKLQAKADKAKAQAEKEKVEAKKKETEAAVKVAEEKAKAAKSSGDKAATAEATKKADKAKEKEKLATIKAAAKTVPATDNTAVAAKADAAAAAELEKSSIDDIPGVSSIHSGSVKEIAKAHFKELIAAGDIKVPKGVKSPAQLATEEDARMQQKAKAMAKTAQDAKVVKEAKAAAKP